MSRYQQVTGPLPGPDPRRRWRCSSRSSPGSASPRSGGTGSSSPTASTSASRTRQFHKDVGFYVFQLPFIRFILDWLFAGLVIILLVTAVAHYLNGGIRFQTPAGSGPPRR